MVAIVCGSRGVCGGVALFGFCVVPSVSHAQVELNAAGQNDRINITGAPGAATRSPTGEINHSATGGFK